MAARMYASFVVSLSTYNTKDTITNNKLAPRFKVPKSHSVPKSHQD